MSERHSDNDGSDIFWPGYVDAVTNLVLNLLFLLTIMTVAVFMFALELGRATNGAASKVPDPAGNSKVASKNKVDAVKENEILKKEIELLKMKLARQSETKEINKYGVEMKTVEVTTALPKPLNRLDKSLQPSDTDILIRFADEAVTFTPAEHNRLRETLKQVVAKGKTNILVEVPAGFSEAKRMGYYRAMAVRNLLIEMKMPKDAIDVSIVESKKNGNASLVKVKSY